MSDKEDSEKMTVSDSVRRGFVHILVGDVSSALERVESSDTDGHRREAVRTMFAAIEGLVWVYREHVRVVADDLGFVTPLLDLALQEKTYNVSDRGDLIELTRFIALPSMVRLSTGLAEKAFPPFKADFSHVGWSKLKKAIIVRNRLTHPKGVADLQIDQDELLTVRSGFYWLLALAIEMMDAAKTALADFNEQAHEILEALKAGDANALAEYRSAMADN